MAGVAKTQETAVRDDEGLFGIGKELSLEHSKQYWKQRRDVNAKRTAAWRRKDV